MPRGGKREGAGRKPNAIRLAVEKRDFLEHVSGRIEEVQALMVQLQEGARKIEIEEALAGNLTRKDVVRMEDGTPIQDKNGKMTIIEVPKFPGLQPTDWVVVKRKRSKLPPDYKALADYLDRGFGQAPKSDPEEDLDDTGEVDPTELDSLTDEKLDALITGLESGLEGQPQGGP